MISEKLRNPTAACRARRALDKSLKTGDPLRIVDTLRMWAVRCRTHAGRTLRSRCNFDWPAASNEPKRGTKATHFVRYEEIQLGKAAAQVMVLFAERGVKEGQEITWSYGDSYKKNCSSLKGKTQRSAVGAPLTLTHSPHPLPLAEHALRSKHID